MPARGLAAACASSRAMATDGRCRQAAELWQLSDGRHSVQKPILYFYRLDEWHRKCSVKDGAIRFLGWCKRQTRGGLPAGLWAYTQPVSVPPRTSYLPVVFECSAWASGARGGRRGGAAVAGEEGGLRGCEVTGQRGEAGAQSAGA